MPPFPVLKPEYPLYLYMVACGEEYIATSVSMPVGLDVHVRICILWPWCRRRRDLRLRCRCHRRFSLFLSDIQWHSGLNTNSRKNNKISHRVLKVTNKLIDVQLNISSPCKKDLISQVIPASTNWSTGGLLEKVNN